MVFLNPGRRTKVWVKQGCANCKVASETLWATQLVTISFNTWWTTSTISRLCRRNTVSASVAHSAKGSKRRRWTQHTSNGHLPHPHRQKSFSLVYVEMSVSGWGLCPSISPSGWSNLRTPPALATRSSTHSVTGAHPEGFLIAQGWKSHLQTWIIFFTGISK